MGRSSPALLWDHGVRACVCTCACTRARSSRLQRAPRTRQQMPADLQHEPFCSQPCAPLPACHHSALQPNVEEEVFTLYKRMHNIKILLIKKKMQCSARKPCVPAATVLPLAPLLVIFLLPLYIAI